VNRGYLPWLLFLSGLWGSSYFLIKVAVDDLEPTVMMSARCLLAGLLLLVFLCSTRGTAVATAQLRAAGGPTLVFGLFNAALPFWLIAWGEKHIDSTVAGIAQATVPIFAFVVALRFLPHEHVAPIRWVGVALGLVGVGVLTGVDLPGGWWAVAGTLAVVGSSLSYAGAGTYAQLRLRDTPGPVLATGGMLIGGLLLLPFALFQLPDAMPGWEAVLSVAALAVVGTTIAQLVYFHMLPLYGNPRISLVAYIMPVFAITYGALFLSESITGGMVIGLGLILAGVALGSGLVLSSRRAKTLEEVL
jgi:drug/metabolite transporter (DMT)-like permease